MRGVWLVFIAIFVLTGCPPEGLTNTCHFEGETTTCGRCIAAQCQRTIDSECASIIKSEAALAALDKCASGKGCSSLFTSYSVSDIGECAKTSCADVCEDATTNGSVACGSTSGGCNCVAGSVANVTKCPTATLTESVCCRSLTWPSVGSQCNCYASTAVECPSATTEPVSKCQ